MADYTLYPAKIGHRFEYATPSGRGDGWRLTHEAAKAAAARGAAGKRPGPNVAAIVAAVLAVALVAGLGAAGVTKLRSGRKAEPASRPEGPLRVLADDRLADVLPVLLDREGAKAAGALEVRYLPSAELGAAARADGGVDVMVATPDVVRTLERVASRAAVAQPFGFDVLTLVVPEGNPKNIDSLSKVRPPTPLRTGICDATDPCGPAADAPLRATSIEPKSLIVVRGSQPILDQVEKQQLDAGLVYRSDLGRHGGPLTGVPLQPDQEARIDYELVVVRDSPQAATLSGYLVGAGEGADARRELGLLSR